MENENQVDVNAGTTPAEQDIKTETQAQAPSQGLDAELNKVKEKKEGRTKLEKLLFTKQRIEQQLEEERKASGLQEEIIEDDTKPLTVGDYKKIKQQEARRSALEMAEEIQDEKERELTIHHLENTIKHTGNPLEDLRLARLLTNSARTAQIVQEVSRKGQAKSHVSGAGAPPIHTPEFEPTPEEAQMMKMKGLDGKPLLSKEDIIKARKK